MAHAAADEIGDDRGSRKNYRTAHLTEALVLRQLPPEHRELPLAQITSLNLNLVGTQPGYKLDSTAADHIWKQLRGLQTLCLSQNALTRLEGFTAVKTLTALDLSDNRLTRLTGIGALTALTSLDVSGNALTRLPCVLVRLSALRTLRAADNRLAVASDLHRLAPLASLTALATRGNPLAALPHARALAVHALPCLDALDGAAVTDAERRRARERFGAQEAGELRAALETAIAQAEQLRARLEAADGALAAARAELVEERAAARGAARAARRRGADLEAAEQLLEGRTRELAGEFVYSRAECAALSQQLAFHAVDATASPQHHHHWQQPHAAAASSTPPRSPRSLAAAGAAAVVALADAERARGEARAAEEAAALGRDALAELRADVALWEERLLGLQRAAAVEGRVAREVLARAQAEAQEAEARTAAAAADLASIQAQLAQAHADADDVAAGCKDELEALELSPLIHPNRSGRDLSNTSLAREVRSVRVEARRWGEAADNARLILAREQDKAGALRAAAAEEGRRARADAEAARGESEAWAARAATARARHAQLELELAEQRRDAEAEVGARARVAAAQQLQGGGRASR
ncbi:hypothetical protein JKP88DRAFT_286234 [Tribonema minus]|uniref:Uncharacterized protein n=1 Tax=Tribonema minus TaxID=303371 RepID=A0A836CNQ6_9STRA|nr:hypothetical protein JKP88DRAFT_286234 [Tribonema minus]